MTKDEAVEIINSEFDEIELYSTADGKCEFGGYDGMDQFEIRGSKIKIFSRKYKENGKIKTSKELSKDISNISKDELIEFMKNL